MKQGNVKNMTAQLYSIRLDKTKCILIYFYYIRSLPSASMFRLPQCTRPISNKFLTVEPYNTQMDVFNFGAYRLLMSPTAVYMNPTLNFITFFSK
jgi:hypothetical protein